jgi:PAS domain S-box-containing protein
MLDPHGTVTNWNKGAERIKGYTEQEIVGQHFSRFYTDEDRKAGLPTEVLHTAAREGRYEGEGWRKLARR